jgi:hypothetical protein
VLLITQAKAELKEASDAWNELDFPLDEEITAVEELAAALKPLEILTKNLCVDQFSVLEADTVFKTAFNYLRRLQTKVGDRLLASLEKRYEERKNLRLLSCLLFLTDPMEYEPEDGLLELSEIRSEAKDLCSRLFPETVPEAGATQADPDPEAASSQGTRSQSLDTKNLSEKLAAQFKEDLKSIGTKKKKTSTDIAAEMGLASKTGDLTERLEMLLRALSSVQASSVDAERTFSTAGRFVTKIRNRLGDRTLDSYCFAHHKFKTDIDNSQVASISVVSKD